MVVDGKKVAYGQLNKMDRLSDLPDCIIHLIISFLGTQEACRTTILSKRWANIWSTGLILDFDPHFFVCYREFGEEFVNFNNFIESTMQRYSEKNLSIRMLRLEYPYIDREMTGRIDGWVGIALQNQVESLSLSFLSVDPPPYALPAILFLAKSLISLTCSRVRVPYFENMKLFSLRILKLTNLNIDDHMLHDIIMSCPLKTLELNDCSGLKNISIPCCSRLESLSVTENEIEIFEPISGGILVDTSSLQRFTYRGYGVCWPVCLRPASKKNLKELRISDVYIESDTFGKLVSELPSIENIRLFKCTMQKSIRIASQKLKELSIGGCYNLFSITMEAPELYTFCYEGDCRLSSVINSHNNYNGYFHLAVYKLDTRAFLVIKHLLLKSNCCKVLSIIVGDYDEDPEIEFDEGKLRNFSHGPLSDAIDVQELKLSLCRLCSVPEVSSRTALIDGLLWCCRPDILSVSVTLHSDNSVMKTFLQILQKKVENWKHPLKRMEIEGTNCSSFLVSWNLEVRLKLYWETVT
ncbi:FBD-associated F-box protein At5g60610-like [Silene latifolia]|uniref:FBD-associated F-box protein At5g60610-like n=1 Tax=Silene latifolia TaxID=37657 RepID=UPI003D774A22